jgi:hypothetical protein
MNLPQTTFYKLVNFLDDRGYDAVIVPELSEGSDSCYIKIWERAGKFEKTLAEAKRLNAILAKDKKK